MYSTALERFTKKWYRCGTVVFILLNNTCKNLMVEGSNPILPLIMILGMSVYTRALRFPKEVNV